MMKLNQMFHIYSKFHAQFNNLHSAMLSPDITKVVHPACYCMTFLSVYCWQNVFLIHTFSLYSICALSVMFYQTCCLSSNHHWWYLHRHWFVLNWCHWLSSLLQQYKWLFQNQVIFCINRFYWNQWGQAWLKQDSRLCAIVHAVSSSRYNWFITNHLPFWLHLVTMLHFH